MNGTKGINYRRGLVRILALALAFIIAGLPVAEGSFVYAAAAKKPAKVKTISLKKATTSYIKIAWSKAKYAKKYQVAYKLSTAKKYKTVKTTKRYYTFKKLKANKVYYFRVRAINGKKYGAWSKIKKFRTKKAAAPVDTGGNSGDDSQGGSSDTDTGGSESGIDYTKAVNEDQVTVTATADEIIVNCGIFGLSLADVYGVAANEYFAGDDISGLVTERSAGTNYGSVDIGLGGELRFPRYSETGFDRIYEKYYIVQDGKIVKGPIYATSVEPVYSGNVTLPAVTKKGLVDEYGSESFEAIDDVNAAWTALNIDLTGLILPNETADGAPIDHSGIRTDTIDVNGKTYYINQDYITGLDYRIRTHTNNGVNVVGIVISFVDQDNGTNYPAALKYIDDARWTNGFNTSNALGRDYFIAAMEYLANRYSGGEYGSICNYVIGNEVDYAHDWYEIIPNTSSTGKALPARNGNRLMRSGEVETRAPFDTFMEEYSRTLRLANLAVKKYVSDGSVSASFSKEWAKALAVQPKNGYDNTNRLYDSYAPRDMINWLNYYSKKSGDYDWGICPHNYPMVSGAMKDASGNALPCAAEYETKLPYQLNVTGKIIAYPNRICGDPELTWHITQNNLEVLQIFLDRAYNLYNGQNRSVYFTENGVSSGDELGTPPKSAQIRQAAAVAQYYYRAASLPSVKAIIYYKVQDRDGEGSLTYKLGLLDSTGQKKLSYDVWKYIDTDKSFEYSEKYLSGINFCKYPNGKEVAYSTDNGRINSYRDVMKMFDSSYDWDAVFANTWDTGALTPAASE